MLYRYQTILLTLYIKETVAQYINLIEVSNNITYILEEQEDKRWDERSNHQWKYELEEITYQFLPVTVRQITNSNMSESGEITYSILSVKEQSDKSPTVNQQITYQSLPVKEQSDRSAIAM